MGDRSNRTAADLVREAIKILQRWLPPGDLNDRQVISELWGLLDNAKAREILERDYRQIVPSDPKRA